MSGNCDVFSLLFLSVAVHMIYEHKYMYHLLAVFNCVTAIRYGKGLFMILSECFYTSCWLTC